jgi:hypothetical protein
LFEASISSHEVNLTGEFKLHNRVEFIVLPRDVKNYCPGRFLNSLELIAPSAVSNPVSVAIRLAELYEYFFRTPLISGPEMDKVEVFTGFLFSIPFRTILNMVRKAYGKEAQSIFAGPTFNIQFVFIIKKEYHISFTESIDFLARFKVY